MDLGVFQTLDFDLSKQEEKKDKVIRESMFSYYIFEKKSLIVFGFFESC